MSKGVIVSAALFLLATPVASWAQQSTTRTPFATIGAYASYIPTEGNSAAFFKGRERATAYFPLFPEGTQVVGGGRGIDEKAETWRSRSTSRTGDTSIVVEFDYETAKVMEWGRSFTTWELHLGSDDRVISGPGPRYSETQIVLQSPIKPGQSWVAGLDKHDQPIVRRVRNFRDVGSPVGCCEAAVIDVLTPTDEVECRREFWVRGIGLVEVRKAYRHPDGVQALPRDARFMETVEILLPGQVSRRPKKPAVPRKGLPSTTSTTPGTGQRFPFDHAAGEDPFDDPIFDRIFSRGKYRNTGAKSSSQGASPHATPSRVVSTGPSLPRSIAGISLGDNWTALITMRKIKLVEPTQVEAFNFVHMGLGSDMASHIIGGVAFSDGKRVIVESNLENKIIRLKLKIPKDTEAYAKKLEERIGVKPKSYMLWENDETLIGINAHEAHATYLVFEDKKLWKLFAQELQAERDRKYAADAEVSRLKYEEQERKREADVAVRAAKITIDFMDSPRNSSDATEVDDSSRPIGQDPTMGRCMAVAPGHGSLVLRAEPRADAAALDTIPPWAASLRYEGETRGNWAFVRWEDTSGWVPAESVRELVPCGDDARPQLGATYVVCATQHDHWLALKSKAGRGGRALARVPEGAVLTFTGQANGRWYAVRYGALHGWVHADYLCEQGR